MCSELWLVLAATPREKALILLTVLFLGCLYFWGICRYRKNTMVPVRYRRGTLISSRQQVQRAVDRFLGTENRATIGHVTVPLTTLTQHALVLGTVGAGKTLLLRTLCSQLLSRVSNPDSPLRVLLYDSKQDTCSWLATLRPDCPVLLLNPTDSRTVAYDIADDIRTESEALTVAEILIPEDSSNQSYFPLNAQRMFVGAVVALNHIHGRNWNLATLLSVCSEKAGLKGAVARCDQTQDLLELFEKKANPEAIHATLWSRLAPLKPAAAVFSKASHSISMRRWLAEPSSILVLGSSESKKAACEAISRIAFSRLTELALSRPDTPALDTVVVLDELREIASGLGSRLNSLVNKGRSKGVALLCGTQDTSGLKAALGENEAMELLSEMNMKFFLRLASGETAEWAARELGRVEYDLLRVQQGWGPGGKSSNFSYEFREQDAIMPAEFLSIRRTSPRTGITGVGVIGGCGVWTFCVPFSEWPRRASKKERELVPDFVPTKPEDEVFTRSKDAEPPHEESTDEDGDGATGGLVFSRF